LVFAYCDDHSIPLTNLSDLREVLGYLTSKRGHAELDRYGGMPPASAAVILRSIVNLETAGAADFFGEPEFDVHDLMASADTGEGMLSLLELSDVIDQPRLFSTFMLWLLAQLYHALPEVGDQPKPKLLFFFDEAHFLFEEVLCGLLHASEDADQVTFTNTERVGATSPEQLRQENASLATALRGHGARVQLGHRRRDSVREGFRQPVDRLAFFVRALGG